MTTIHSKDRVATYAVTNYLLAAYQGRFTFLNILAQLEYPNLQLEALTKTREAIDKITLWNEDLFDDKPIFLAHWTSAETPDAQDALSLLQFLKPDLLFAAQEVSRILLLPIPTERKEDLAFLIAAFGRHAYARENYIRGFLEFGQKYKQERESQNYASLLPSAQDEIRNVHTILTTVRDPQKHPLPPELLRTVVERCIPIVSSFRTHVHDINLLIARYKGGPTFDNTDFTPSESSGWRSHEIRPEVAGYWRACGFKADDAAAWLQNGIGSPTTASAWRLFGFTPESAIPWIKCQFPPPFARMWHQSGFTAAQTKELVARGVADPSKAKKESGA